MSHIKNDIDFKYVEENVYVFDDKGLRKPKQEEVQVMIDIIKAGGNDVIWLGNMGCNKDLVFTDETVGGSGGCSKLFPSPAEDKTK